MHENETRIDYAFRQIYKALENVDNRSEESVKNTVKYYLIDLADRQREDDMTMVHTAFNKWDKTKPYDSGMDTLTDRIVNMIRNEISFNTEQVREKYKVLTNDTLKNQ